MILAFPIFGFITSTANEASNEIFYLEGLEKTIKAKTV